MPITKAKRAYRAKPEEQAKRAEYSRLYRQRPEVKARERERARRRRAAPGGAVLNVQRVTDNRTRLGRNYVSQLVSAATGVACRDIPDDVVHLKRDALLLRRLSTDLHNLANKGPDK